jgi:hypothetical protein
MIGWVVTLPEVAADAVAELSQTTGQPGQHVDHILWTWRKDDSWIRSHPTEATVLIRWLAERRSLELWMCSDAVKQLEIALEAGASSTDVCAAAEALAQMSCQAALDLLKRVRDDPL